MKRVCTLILVVILLFSNEFVIQAAKVDSDDSIILENLIFEGETIADPESPEAYVWITKVLNFNEKYSESNVYSDIKSACISAKGHSSISTFNELNKILGYLGNLEDELYESGLKNIESLITEGKKIADTSSASAYKWIIDVLKTNEEYTDSFVYSDIKSTCTSAKGHSSISTFNELNKILGYLGNLEDELYESGLKNIESLITEGKKIADTSSASAYKWIIDVLKTNEEYKDSFVYSDIKGVCISAKGHSSISTFNELNKILGYLDNLKGKVAGTESKSVQDLITEGERISDKSSPEAYTWLIDVMLVNERYKQTSVYSDIKSICASAKGHSSISTFNEYNQILADLIILENEIPVSSVLQSISVAVPADKTIYIEGEVFDAAGLKVNATYLNTYKDSLTDISTEEVTGFIVDITTKLKCDDTCCVISYTEGEITKTTTLEITVNPYILSKTLKNIMVAVPPSRIVYKEGETFQKTGMQINAVFDIVWSNGETDIEIEEDVPYSVDTTTKLTYRDDSVMITVTDNGITKTAMQAITVESYIVSTVLDSISIMKNPVKTSYVEGEKFDKTGLTVNATYKNEWSNGYIQYTTQSDVKYHVNTTAPLLCL